MESQGVHLAGDDITPEGVAAHCERIADVSAARPFDSASAALMGALAPK
jgi:hypothetical protein